jgi:hypothetical protein
MFISHSVIVCLGSKEIGTAKGSGEFTSTQEVAKKAIQQHEDKTQEEYFAKYVYC